MANSFSGWLIMIGIGICLIVSIGVAVMEYREDKRLKKAAEQEAEFRHKRIDAAHRHQIEQMKLRYEQWKDVI